MQLTFKLAAIALGITVAGCNTNSSKGSNTASDQSADLAQANVVTIKWETVKWSEPKVSDGSTTDGFEEAAFACDQNEEQYTVLDSRLKAGLEFSYSQLREGSFNGKPFKYEATENHLIKSLGPDKTKMEQEFNKSVNVFYNDKTLQKDLSRKDIYDCTMEDGHGTVKCMMDSDYRVFEPEGVIQQIYDAWTPYEDCYTDYPNISGKNADGSAIYHYQIGTVQLSTGQSVKILKFTESYQSKFLCTKQAKKNPLVGKLVSTQTEYMYIDLPSEHINCVIDTYRSSLKDLKGNMLVNHVSELKHIKLPPGMKSDELIYGSTSPGL